MERLTYGGKSFSDFNTFWDGSKVFAKPIKNYNIYDIPGRNGSLTASRKYFGNLTVSFDCFIRQDFKKNFSQLIDYLNSMDGYQRLETTTEPEIYRMALFHSAVDPSTGAFNHYGKFTITFDCMPQAFLKSGEIPVEIPQYSTEVLNNPTYQKAKPLIIVNGVGTFYVNGQEVTVNSNPGNVYIDSELMDCYSNTGGVIGNMNPYVIVPEGFINLVSGDNTIETKGVSLSVMPRWWRV